MRFIAILFILSAIMGGCSGRTSAVKPGKQKFIEEIQMAESDFQKMAKEKGVDVVFNRCMMEEHKRLFGD